jgi:Putative T7SS secretion signal domain
MIEIRPGQTAAELVPGEPDEVERLAARLSRFAAGAGDASVRLRGLDSAHWSGAAAELFREAVGPMPQQLSRAGSAFTLAARALAGYARTLRDAQASAAQAIRLVEQSTPDSVAADRDAARQLVERARGEVAEASRVASARLSELAADAPTDAVEVAAAGAPGLRAGGLTVRAVTEHELADPEGFVGPARGAAESVLFGVDHAVPFAGAAGGESGTAGGWESWAQQGGGRELGVVGVSVLAGLGIGAIGLIGRRRRDRTALATAGIDEAELRSRRVRFGAPARVGHAVRTRAAGPRSADTWRTRLASPPHPGATVHVWAASKANPLAHARRAEPVPMSTPGPDVTGAVLRTGPPPEEGRRDSGASR